MAKTNQQTTLPLTGNEVAKLPDFTAIAKELNNSVSSVFGKEAKEGFEKAYLVANAVQQLQTLLTPEIMKPIMSLQGNSLGFKTDKDINRDGTKGQGYDEGTVKNCLIEAVLKGVQPVGNHFNILANNCYLTKEGVGYLLKNIPGLWYEITPELPRINNDKTGAAIVMNIEWKFKDVGTSINTKRLDIPVKMNAYMGTDAVIGKATRKARAWLYNTITGSEIADGDITDMQEAKRQQSANERAGNLTAETEQALKDAAAKAASKGH